MNRLFVDTSAWYAFFDAKDPSHSQVSALLREWAGRILTTDYVFDEIITLVRYRAGHALAVRTGEALRQGGSCLIATAEPCDLEEAWVVFKREASQKLSFTDCVSFAVMRRLKLSLAAALDDDFRRAGFTALPMS